MSVFYQLVQDTYISMTVLLIVALGGLLAERSGVTNIALEGIMVMGAFLGIWSVKGLEVFPFSPLTKFIIFFVSFIIALSALYSIYLFLRKFLRVKLKKNILLTVLMVSSLVLGFILFSFLSNQAMNKQLILIMGIIIGGVIGGLYAMLHAYAAIHMKSDQVISATALNLFAPAFAVFTARIIQDGGGQQIGFTSTFRIQKIPFLGDIPVIGELLFTRVYLSFYIGLALLGILWVVIYKTKFGLRLRACGENPHAADSLGINIYRLRFIAVTLSGFFAGMGGVIFVATTSTEFNVTVAGFGFLAIAVLIFGNWRPSRIVMAALFFGFMRTIASSYSVIPFLSGFNLPTEFYNMIPYLATLVILAFFSKNSRAPKALGQIYDQGKR